MTFSRMLTAAVCSAVCVAALAFAPAGSAAPTAAPVVLSLTVSGPRPLPARGTPVVVSVRVANASSCTFLRQYSAFSSLYPYRTVPCASGRAAVVIPAISNGYKAPVHLSFEVRATGSGGVARRIVKVAQAAASATPPPPVTVITPPAPAAPPRPSYSLSANWAGYVLPSTTSAFTDASGTFTVPSLNCSVTSDAGVMTWVGIGGAEWPQGGSSGTLLQTGVQSDCVGGAQQNEGWWEMFPSNPNRSFVFYNFPVSTGDSITAAVYQSTSDSSWWTRLDDTTTGLSAWMQTGGHWGVGTDASGHFYYQGSSALLSYSGALSAEWVVEDYTEPDSQTLAPLADFGTVSFTNLRTAGLANWDLTAEDGVALEDSNGNVLAVPSPPGSDGSFTVSYQG